MRAFLCAVLIAAVASGTAQSPAPPQPPAPPPATDIHLLPLAGELASLKNARPLPVSTAPGYDNQPMFSADGQRLLFAANRDGQQIDIFAFERSGNRVTQLTRTPENENSPTYLLDGIGDAGGFSVVRTEADRTQRLWRFDARGLSPQLVLPGIKPVGYHAWVDAGTVALFVLGPPSTLQIASLQSGTAEIAAESIGRSLHRIPGTRLVSFVQREPSGELWLKQIETGSRKIEPLVKAVAGSTDGDMAWLPDGRTILMSSGTTVSSWTRGAAEWTVVFDAAPHGLGAVSRLAVSPKGDAVAIVVAEQRK
jgi:Tol biopolymer transport system component